MKKIILLSSIGMLMSFLSFSQDFSNKGKEFWLAYCYHVGMLNPGNGGPPSMTLNITSDITTTYQVEIYGGAVIAAGTVNANAVVNVTIPNTYFVNADGLFNGRAVHVTSAEPIVVYSFITRSQASAATLCLPTTVLDKQYYTMSFTQISNETNANSFITIVAVEDNTSVQIVPTAPTQGGWAAGSVNVISLNKGQVYQVLGTVNNGGTGPYNGVDLSGTSVQSIASGTSSCKRIAVFSGSGKLALGCSTGTADNLYQQLYPVVSWGKKYLTVPSYNRSLNYYRILRSDPATNVTLNGTALSPASFTNGYYQFSNTIPNIIQSDIPVSVTQYFTSQSCMSNGAPYDPDMAVLNPVEQNISTVTLVSTNLLAAGNPHQHHLHVIMPNGGTGISSFRFDGAAIPATAAWVVHPGAPNYSYLYLPNVTETSHTLASDSGFNALAYGYSDAETYFYSAGTNVKDLLQQISTQTQYGIETSPSVCTGSPFKFKISLPYQPLEMDWDLSSLPAGTTPNHNNQTELPYATCPSTTTNVCYDSTTFINGKQVWWYSLPIFYSIPAIGNYPVSITALTNGADGCGNSQEIDFILEVSNPPVAGFTYTQPGCIADSVHFTDATTTVKPEYHWYWNFGDPASGPRNISSVENPAHLFSTTGNHVVRFASITTPGCLSDTLSKTIFVPAQPSATISGSTTVCKNATAPNVSFSIAGGTAPYVVSYHINGGPILTATTTGTSTSATVAASTAAAGSFIYSIDSVRNATGSGLCDTHIMGQSATVTVNPLPVAAISGTVSVCQNAAAPLITFTGSGSTPPYTFTYHINSGSSRLISTTGASSTVSVSAPTAISGNYIYTLTNVKDAAATACTAAASGTATVSVNALPTATLAGNNEVCLNAAPPSITFTGTGGTAPYKFSYTITTGGVTGPVQTVSTTSGSSVSITASTATAGTYVYNLVSVQESSSTSCINNQTGSVTTIIDPKPTASFTAAAPYCAANNITFTPIYSVSTGSVVSWLWNYGDGTGSHTRPNGNPFSINYSTAGPKTVTFQTVSDKGCQSAVFTQIVTVNPKPVAGFIAPEVCLLDPFAQFTDSSKVAAPGMITTHKWNFGDANATPTNPNTSGAQNPTHVYTQVGPYTIQLIAITNSGCRDTITHSIFISDGNPQANFNVINAAGLCSNDSVGMINKSTIVSGNITRLKIYWDDLNQPAVFDSINDPVFNFIFKHKYPTLSTTTNYRIHVLAYSGGVCYTSRDTVITVNATPVVQLNAFPDVCLNNGSLQFTEGSQTSGAPGTGVYSGVGVTPGGLFDPLTAGAGVHQIVYTFTSTAGCTDTKAQNVKVLAAPIAKFSPSLPNCQNTAINFRDSSFAPAGTLVKWVWHWGDGSPDATYTSGGPRSHVYTLTGNVTATLSVTTDYGCNSLPTPVSFTINPQPLPNFTFTLQACLPAAKIDFTNQTPNLSSWIYSWNFDDVNASGTNPNTSSAQNPSHIYTTLGPHNVRLRAVSASTQCSHDTVIAVNTIHPAPVAAFSISKPNICIDQSISVTDQSDPVEGTITQWTWDYGDNSGVSQGQGQSPHIYSASGTYPVMLHVVNSYGCTDDTATSLVVYPYPKVDAGPDQTVLQGSQVQLLASATGNNLTFLWSPTSFLDNVRILQPVSMPVADIVYKLTVTAQGGCMQSDSVLVHVLKYPEIPNTFTPNNDGIHDKWEIKYLYQYPDARVQVFTRTGQMVFESHGYSEPWDGTKGGKPLPFDTYYYIIEPGSGRKAFTGYVTILK